MRDILNSTTLYGHFLLRLLAILLFTGFMIYLVLPLIFWSLFREGASSEQVGHLPIGKFIETWRPLILAIMLLGIEKVDLSEFIENGKRGWDAVYENNDKMGDFGIIPATNENEQKLKSAINSLTKPELVGQPKTWWTKFKDRFTS